MTVYIILLVYLLLIEALSKSLSEKRRRNFQVIFGGLGLWLVLALRSVYCGVDLMQGEAGTRNYLWMFEEAQLNSFSSFLFGYGDRLEAGWMVLCKLFSLFSDDFNVFLAFIAAIQIFLIGFVLYRTSSNIIFSYIIYFCFGLYALSFSGLRQATAFAITFFASYYLLKDKLKLFFLLIVLASTIHQSALIFLIVFFIRKLKFTKSRAITLFAIVILVLPVLGYLVSVISSALFSSHYNAKDALDSGGAYTMFIVYGLLVLLSLRFPNNRENDFIRYMIMLAFASQSLGTVSSTYLTRIGYYFQMYFLLYFPILLETYIDKNSRGFVQFVGSLLFLAFFYLTMVNSPLAVIPYKFFWELY